MTIERDSADERLSDKFDRAGFVQQVSDLLYSSESQRATGLVVGMTGPWGSGKSQALLFVKRCLEETACNLRKTHGQSANPIIIIQFNPWLYSGRDVLLQQLFRLVKDEVDAAAHKYPDLKKTRILFDEFRDKYRDKIKKALKIGGLFYKPVGGIIEAFTEEDSLEKQKDSLLRNFQDENVSIIVLVDEIDRLSDGEIRDMAQVVKSVADFPMFSYLLAYDPDRVAKALGGDDLKLGHHYLEKIVQVQMRLPRVSPRQLINYILDQPLPIPALHQDSPIGVPDEEKERSKAAVKKVLYFLVPEVLSTPRDARRITAAYTARLPLVGNEVDQLDLLRYCALEARVPVLSERLQNLATRVSVDGYRELQRRIDPILPREECIQHILGEFCDETALRELLLYLFPALREGGAEVVARDDTRLCYETPLLTLLNYRPLPDLVSLEDAMNALRNPDTDLKNLLMRAANNDRLRHSILRLRSAAKELERKASLDKSTMEAQWRCLGEFFDQPLTSEQMYRWAPWLDLTHVWVRGVLRNFLSNHPIKAEFIKKLIKGGSVHLPARVLFFHLQAHGLCGVSKDAELRPKLTMKETHDLVVEAAQHFTESILSERSQWRLRSVVPLWIIRAGDPTGHSWRQVCQALSSPENKLSLDGVLVLLLRSKIDTFQGEILADQLDLEQIAGLWNELQGPEEELRSPVDAAHRYLQSKLRASDC